MPLKARAVGANVLFALILLGAVGAVALYSGAYDVAATRKHTALLKWVLETGRSRSVAARARRLPDPPPFDSVMRVHGFDHYRDMCVDCHGAPGVERGEIGKGMNPTPPDLDELAPKRTPRELFWVLRNGIKLAGMPAFGPTHSDAAIWDMVAFLEALPQLSAAEYSAWEGRYADTDEESPEGMTGQSHSGGE